MKKVLLIGIFLFSLLLTGCEKTTNDATKGKNDSIKVDTAKVDTNSKKPL